MLNEEKSASGGEPQNQVIKKGMPLWLSTVLIIIIAGLAIGGTWYVMDQKVRKNDDKVATLQGQVDKLMKDAAKVTPTPTMVKTQKAVCSSETVNQRNYANSNFSFSYPGYYKCIFDNLQKIDSQSGINEKLEMTVDEPEDGKPTPTIEFWYDPAGFSVGFPAISYSLNRNGNKLTYTKQVEPKTDLNNGDFAVVVASGSKFTIKLSYNKNLTEHDYLNDLENIFDSFVIN